MDAKLTLKLDQDIIERAKNYAKVKNTSLSQLIESYLGMLVEPRPIIHEVTPFVKSLSGIVDLPENFDSKEAYKKYIQDKYSK